MAVSCGLKHEQRQSDNSSKWRTVPHMYTPGKKRMHVSINRSELKVACRTMGLPGTIPCVLTKHLSEECFVPQN